MLTCVDSTGQNRELQIMRLVSHPNVVDLKAFFYSNGDKVGLYTHRDLASHSLPF